MANLRELTEEEYSERTGNLTAISAERIILSRSNGHVKINGRGLNIFRRVNPPYKPGSLSMRRFEEFVESGAKGKNGCYTLEKGVAKIRVRGYEGLVTLGRELGDGEQAIVSLVYWTDKQTKKSLHHQ